MIPIIEKDPALKPYEADLQKRVDRYQQMKRRLLKKGETLNDFANAYMFYGIHHTNEGWVYREWAPGADQLYLTGEFVQWNWTAMPMTRLDHGNWEIRLPEETLHTYDKVMTIVKNGDKLTQHLPLYATRHVQDETTKVWCCEVWDDRTSYAWTDQAFSSNDPLLIYEAHVGMSSEEPRVASYVEFADNVLPHIKENGYNTVQLMAVMEHPYYGSFGYQVSGFFAASSRFGTPDELKYLVNKAHGMGIRVLLDLVHSHAVKNTTEGINLFDGTEYQFFHAGPAGEHPAWGTKCFNYDKPEVIHFLLSNLKFWLTEYHFDGFRFDGVTSMLYHNHGLGQDFSLASYFTMNTDVEAITYLQLANELVRQVKPSCITIAEDMSGMPGMCEPVTDGGIGFDYRLGMGLPDMWIKLIKTKQDQDWNLDSIWKELTFRTARTIAYAESHDQALVGDQTLMFRMAGAAMYTDMDRACHSLVIDRAMALHKMIRLLTITAGGDGYLNFMGNEFGHPEWIDFPREGNGWGYAYCRRQWSLLTNGYLKYGQLYDFDRAMVQAVTENHLLKQRYPDLKAIHVDDHILAYERGGLLMAFNFSPDKSYTDYRIPVSSGTDYEVLFTSDDKAFGGYGRISHAPCSAYIPGVQGNYLRLYLPARTAMVLRPVSSKAKA